LYMFSPSLTVTIFSEVVLISMVLHCIKWRDAKSRKGALHACPHPNPLDGK
jgi:hypothetical protein